MAAPHPGLIQRYGWPVVSLLLGVAWVALALFHHRMGADHLRGQELGNMLGHMALLGLALILLSRPLAPWFPQLIKERRWLGLITFGFALAHTSTALEHNLGGRWDGLFFLTPWLQYGVWIGVVSLALMIPLALTSFDLAVRVLGRFWNLLHQLILPAALAAVVHTLWVGVHYLGTQVDEIKTGTSFLLILAVLGIGWLRSFTAGRSSKK